MSEYVNNTAREAGRQKALTRRQQRLAIETFTRALNGEDFRLGGNGKKVVVIPIEQKSPQRA